MRSATDKPDPQPPLATVMPTMTEESDGKPQSTTERQQVKVIDSKAVCSYANFCRVTGTPEELIVDFGLNTQSMGVPSEPIEVSQRIVVNFFTAKRLLSALQMSVQRHESVFGVLETDIQKRVQTPASRQSASAPPR
jgi:uncharacterized protein DUF3467